MSLPARSPLFGRGPELELLRTLLDQPSQRGSALVIWGGAGSGKSALLVEAGRHAEETGRHLLHATGVESEMTMPFAGLHQLLGPVLGGLDGLPDGQRQALLDAFGSTRGSPEVFLVALATLNLLGDLAARQHVAVLVDDSQWLDAPTVEVLRFIARRLESDPIALVISCRDGFEGALAVSEAGEIELRGDDIGGISAHIGARVASLAGPHEVLVSRTVRDLVAGSGLSFTDRGVHELKGVPDSWHLYAASRGSIVNS